MRNRTHQSKIETMTTTLTLKQAEQAFLRLDYDEALRITSELLHKSTEENGEICAANGPLALLYGKVMYKIGQKQQEEQLATVIAKAKEKQDKGEKFDESTDKVDDVMEDEDNEENEENEEDEFEEEGEEDALEEAWNILELARLCFENQLEKNENVFVAKNNLVEVYCLEAQVLAEQDHFEDAVTEYEKSLEYIPQDDLRKISEVKCQCGDYSMFAGDVNRALSFYKDAQGSLDELVKITNDENDKEVLFDLTQRISDIENNPQKFTQQPSLNNAIKEINEGSQDISTTTSQTNEDKPVNILEIRR